MRIRIGLLIRLMRCAILTAITPTRVEIADVINIGINISVGCVAPICARYIIILIGISINPEVLSTRNITIGLVAVSFRGFSS